MPVYFDLSLEEGSAVERLQRTYRRLLDLKESVLLKIFVANFWRMPSCLQPVPSEIVLPLILSSFPGPRSEVCHSGKKVVGMTFAVVSKFFPCKQGQYLVTASKKYNYTLYFTYQVEVGMCKY